MQSSVATAVCGRCRRQCIAYGPKRRSRGGWRWTSNERNRQVDAVQPWLLSTRLALDPKVPAFLATVSVNHDVRVEADNHSVPPDEGSTPSRNRRHSA